MAKDDKKVPEAEDAGKVVEKPAAPREADNAPKQLSRAELEALRRDLQKRFH